MIHALTGTTWAKLTSIDFTFRASIHSESPSVYTTLNSRCPRWPAQSSTAAMNIPVWFPKIFPDLPSNPVVLAPHHILVGCIIGRCIPCDPINAKRQNKKLFYRVLSWGKQLLKMITLCACRKKNKYNNLSRTSAGASSESSSKSISLSSNEEKMISSSDSSHSMALGRLDRCRPAMPNKFNGHAKINENIYT